MKKGHQAIWETFDPFEYMQSSLKTVILLSFLNSIDFHLRFSNSYYIRFNIKKIDNWSSGLARSVIGN